VVARKARTYHRTQIIQWMSSVLSDLYPFAQAEEAISRLPRRREELPQIAPITDRVPRSRLVSSLLVSLLVPFYDTALLHDTKRPISAVRVLSRAIAREQHRYSLFEYADTRSAMLSWTLFFFFSLPRIPGSIQDLVGSSK